MSCKRETASCLLTGKVINSGHEKDKVLRRKIHQFRLTVSIQDTHPTNRVMIRKGFFNQFGFLAVVHSRREVNLYKSIYNFNLCLNIRIYQTGLGFFCSLIRELNILNYIIFVIYIYIYCFNK